MRYVLALALMLVAPDALAQVAPIPGQAQPVPVVVDSAGKVVGPLVGPNFVALTVGGQVVVTMVGPNGLSQAPYSLVRYADAACTEPGYLDAFSLPIPAHLVGTDLVMPGPDQQVRALGYSKLLAGAGAPTGCTPDAASVRVGPLVRTPVGSLGLQPPFTAQMK